jgi:hypothetical protein
MTLFRPLDFILLFLVITIATGSFLLLEKKAGSVAEVYVEDRLVATFSLRGSIQKKKISTQIGPMLVQYGEGTIQVIKSSCSNKICILQGQIKHAHEQIVCLPADFQIIIKNGTESQDSSDLIDAISY